MGSHIKQESLGCTENCFGTKTVFPVWQMVQDDEENEEEEKYFDAESVTRLTGNVRACYLNHLEKIVIKNYETCSDNDRTEWPFSRVDLLKCAAWLEYKALRSCMVVILYQRAMTRLVADIKKHTEQLKIYTKLKHFMSFDTRWSTKTTQTCEKLNFTDQGTQTDIGGEMHLYTDNNEYAFQTHSLQTDLETDHVNYQCSLQTELESDNMNYQCLQSMDDGIRHCEAECANDETLPGVPIPVFVSGISSVGFKRRNTQNIRVVKNIEPISFSEINTVQNIPVVNGIERLSSETVDVPNNIISFNEINTMQNIPVLNGLEHISSVNVGVPNSAVSFSEINTVQNVPVLNGVERISSNTLGVPNSDYNGDISVAVEEPYEWSVIEGKNKLKRSPRPRVRVRRLSNMQDNKPMSNGMFSLSKDDEETAKMTIDERIAAVFGIENPEFSEEDEVPSEKSDMEVDEEPSIWTIHKCEHQELLRAKILEKCVFNVKKRGQMRLRFLELFGSDSEDCFDIDEDVTNYKDKLARWVVVSLMPYYREGRILSRPVFKCVARHIADKLLKKNHWPSESDVMQSVVEFFSFHKKIESKYDIRS